MKKISLVLIIFVLFQGYCKAQKKQIDSLLSVIKVSKIDTTYVHNLNTLAFLISGSKPDSAISISQSAISLVSKFIKKGDINFNTSLELEKAISFNNIGLSFKNKNFNDSAMVYYNRSLTLNNSIFTGGEKQFRSKAQKGLADNYANIASIFRKRRNYKDALYNYQKAQNLFESIEDNNGLGGVFQNLGTLYNEEGKQNYAMEYYLKALRIFETLGNKMKAAIVNVNIANIYTVENKSKEALQYYQNGLETFLQIGNLPNIGKCYLNIASIHYYRKQYDIALEYSLKAKDIFEKIQDSYSLSATFNTLGAIYCSKNDYSNGISYLKKALQIFEQKGEQLGIAVSYNSIGAAYIQMGMEKEGRIMIEKGLEKGKELSILSVQKEAYLLLSQCDSIANHFENSFENLKKYIVIKDSIFSENANKQITEMQTKYETEKKDIEIERINKEQELKQLKFEYEKKQSQAKNEKEKQELKYEEELKRKNIEFTFEQKQAKIINEQKQKDIVNIANQEKKDAISKKEIERQKIVRNSFFGGFALMFLFAVLSYSNFRRKKKDNQIITQQKIEVENQKHLVEEKNREILDSIEYALRIQTAILPPQKIVKQYLENSFILYKPKDIVAGDFYWMETVNDLVLFAACDCTGHGVPGAMVSVVCHNALNRAVREFCLTEPAAILDKTAEIVLENFSKSDQEIHDGMDISICALNTKTKTLEWAGANNSLLLINNGQLTETKADKQCIGYNENVKPFTNHQFNLQPNTSVYLFTDGYADQFGGQPERKLTKNRFRALLLSIQHLTVQQQAKELDDFLANYKKEIEQTDDILVIGVRV
jgi:serine phosphatase RsbU (regulator of sigma subunit)